MEVWHQEWYFQIEKNPTDDRILVLTINKQAIGEWFREEFAKLWYGFREIPDEPRREKDLGYKQ